MPGSSNNGFGRSVSLVSLPSPFARARVMKKTLENERGDGTACEHERLV